MPTRVCWRKRTGGLWSSWLRLKRPCSYDPGYPSGDYDYCPDDPGYPSGDYDSCPDNSGYPSGDYDFCSDNSGKLSIPDGRVKATASMELSHLRGQSGRYAFSDEQRPSTSTITRCYVGSIRFRGKGRRLCLQPGWRLLH